MTKAVLIEKIKNASPFYAQVDGFVEAFEDGIKGNKTKVQDNELYFDIIESLDNLNYYSVQNDKRNMRADGVNLNNDFRKATIDARKKIEHGETISSK